MTRPFAPLTRRRVCASLLAAPALATLTSRAAWAALEGPVILTVSGQIDEGSRAFDLSALDALPQRETTTATPWHDGRPTFSGPTLAGIVEAVGATGTTLRIRALNDYAADMPLEDALSVPVILASRIDGSPISVRDKGPLFVIYPFDENPDLFNEVYVGRSVWQVSGIEVIG